MKNEQDALSVSSAMALAKGVLEGVNVRIMGEVSELSINPRYKAVYFTVKDASAALPCMMWNDRFRASGVEIKIGDLVEISGRFTLYAAKGRMNFDVAKIELAGEGKLRMQVAALAQALKAEGLMEPSRKKQIPLYPNRIGLVTSPRGAAVYDVLRTLRRRYPLAEIKFAGVTVEGKNAAFEMINALEAIDNAGVDVILLVRGGGSFEDLMPFNDEALARKIASMKVPIITGIGHEPDTSIADMVADLRASTPTAAAESASAQVESIEMSLNSLSKSLNHAIDRRLKGLSDLIARYAASSYLKDPFGMLSQDAMHVDDLSRRLRSLFEASYAQQSADIAVIKRRLSSIGVSILSKPNERLSAYEAALKALFPLEVLARGYSITRSQNGSIIKSAENVEVNQEISVQLSDGILGCKVIEVEKTELDIIEMEE